MDDYKRYPPPVGKFSSGLARQIRDMKPESTLLFPDGNKDSIKVTVSMARKENPGRIYKTANTPEGVRVWRLPDIETSQKESKHVTSKKG